MKYKSLKTVGTVCTGVIFTGTPATLPKRDRSAIHAICQSLRGTLAEAFLEIYRRGDQRGRLRMAQLGLITAFPPGVRRYVCTAAAKRIGLVLPFYTPAPDERRERVLTKVQ